MVAADRVGESAEDVGSYWQLVDRAVRYKQRVVVILWTLLLQGDPAAATGVALGARGRRYGRGARASVIHVLRREAQVLGGSLPASGR